MNIINAAFSVPYQFSVIFTDTLLSEQAELQHFFSAIKQDALILPIIEQEILNHHPTINDDLQQLLKKSHLTAVPSLVLTGGELGKNTPSLITEIIDQCIKNQIDRHSYIIAIGGGAFIDMVGYAATITHRGIRLIRMPTTVLGQNDAGVGVKNAINYQGRKNFLGTFSPPYAVINNYNFIESLPVKDKRAGIAEAIKVSLIKDAAFFDFLSTNKQVLKEFESSVMKKMIKDCASLHLNHICHNGDPFELGSARPLDFGHWSAHALEELSNFTLRHGEAVAIGILIDAKYSFYQQWISVDEFTLIEELIATLGFPICNTSLSLLNIEESLDNFRVHLGGELCITMLKNIGQCHEVNTIDTRLMARCVNELIADNSETNDT
jgi:3-dehydroquinate synthase